MGQAQWHLLDKEASASVIFGLILYCLTMDELCNKSLISLVLAAVMTVYPGGRESYKAASGK